MNWLTMQVLQYIAGGLLLACMGLGVRGCALDSARDVAVANQGKAEAARDAVVTEREAWKEVASTAQETNADWQRIWGVIEANQAREREESARLAGIAAEQVAAAKRDEAKAERVAAEYRRVFGAKPKDCDAALLALDRICPTLRNY